EEGWNEGGQSQNERIVEAAGVSPGEFPEPRTDRMGAVDILSGEELEDDQLGGEQDHESGDQRPRSQEGHVRETRSKLVRGKGWYRELGRRPSRRLCKLVYYH